MSTMEPQHPPDLMQLMRAARAGDRQAVAALITAVTPAVRTQVHQRLARSYRRHNDWAVSLFSTGDVVQDLLLGVIAELQAFRGGDAHSLMAWLAAQVEHRILERLRYFRAGKRDQRRVSSLDETRAEALAATVSDPQPSPSVAAESAEIWVAIREAMTGLTDEERTLLEYGLDPDMQWLDVARALGLGSAEAARQRHKRARARLSLRLAARFPHLLGDAP